MAVPFVATRSRGPDALAAELPASSARVGQAARRCGALDKRLAHIGSTTQGLQPASQAGFASGQPPSKSKAAARRPN